MGTTGSGWPPRILGLLPFVFAIGTSAQMLNLVPEATAPLVQLTGEHFQFLSRGVYFTAPTNSQTMSRFGALGADLGVPVVYSDKIIILFGDTMATRIVQEQGEQRFAFVPKPRGTDSIGYIPNMDFSQCDYIVQVDRQIRDGNPKPNVSLAGCPELRLYRNPKSDSNNPAFMATSISGLDRGDNTGEYGVPTGAVQHNGRMYVFYIVKNQALKPHFSLKSIVARSNRSPSEWSDESPPKFSKLYTVSTHPEIENPSSPPPEDGRPGKFMFNPTVVMGREELATHGMARGLPPSLNKAAKVAFVFGSSWKYNRSNLYLAAFSLDDIEQGTSRWLYFTGTSGGETAWSRDEAAATPLLPESPNIGDHSVVWNKTLKRFVLMYGNIVTRFGASPWGPWGRPILTQPPRATWSMNLVHHSKADPIKRTVVPVFGRDAQTALELSSHEEGIPYGPGLIDKHTVNADGSVTLYYLMSTWNPYQVFLAKSTFAFAK